MSHPTDEAWPPETGPVTAQQRPYLLTPQQANDLFQTRIRPLIEPTVAGLDRPTALILGGQPAAGKTSVQAALRTGDPTGHPPGLPGAVGLDIDMFDHFHPAFDTLRRSDPHTARALIRPDALRQYGMAGQYLVERRSNIIYEHALRDLDRVATRIQRHVHAGYQVELALLAVPRAVSLLHGLSRYQTQLETTADGRWVPVDVHDLRYERAAQAADRFSTDPALGGLRVYGRGGVLLHYQEGPRHDNAATAALEAERYRPWSVAETESFRQLHDSLAARMHPSWRGELDRAMQAADPWLNPAAPTGPWRHRHAITFGRYQIVSIAHLDTVRTILRQWPAVTVGVLDPDLGPGGPLDAEAPTRWAPERNPLPAEARVRMWRDVVEAAGLSDRVRIVPVAGMTPDPAQFNHDYPPEQYDMVFPQPEGEGFDLVRNDLFRSQFGRDVHEVTPSVTYHTSAMRQLARVGDPAWQLGLAPGAARAFAAANGPRLLMGVDTPVPMPPQPKPTPTQPKPTPLQPDPRSEQRLPRLGEF